jgi:hypothetical protein
MKPRSDFRCPRCDELIAEARGVSNGPHVTIKVPAETDHQRLAREWNVAAMSSCKNFMQDDPL